MFISRIFHLIFSDHGWQQETKGNETVGQKEALLNSSLHLTFAGVSCGRSIHPSLFFKRFWTHWISLCWLNTVLSALRSLNAGTRKGTCCFWTLSLPICDDNSGLALTETKDPSSLCAWRGDCLCGHLNILGASWAVAMWAMVSRSQAGVNVTFVPKHSSLPLTLSQFLVPRLCPWRPCFRWC